MLFRYTPTVRWQKFAEHTGETPDAIRKRLADSGYAQACDLGRLKSQKAYLEGVRLLGKRLSEQRFTQIWVSAFRPDEAVVALVMELKAHCAVALLSNNSTMVRSGLESAYPHVLELFRPRMFSADLGVMKPDPRAFAAALELLGCAPEEALLIDDSVNNVSIAESLGLNGHVFTEIDRLRAVCSDQGLL